MLQLNFLQRVDDAILELLDTLSHVFILILALQVEVHHRNLSSLGASVLLKQLIFQFLV